MRSSRKVEPLGDDHQLDAFSSGQEDLDDWLRRHARQAEAMDSARTFVLVEAGTVLGYFSLTMGSVRREDAPRRLVRGLPGYPLGIVLLARLAVDASSQGRGLGAEMLAAALHKALLAAEAAAARLVVVDAIDEKAAAFYRHFDFLPAPEHPRRLYRRTKDIRLAFDRAKVRREVHPGS